MIPNYIQKLLFLLLFQSFLFSSSFNIVGKILDTDTREPLNSVNIFVPGTDLGTATNEDGNFILIIDNYNNNQISLNVKIIGYELKTILVNQLEDKIDLGSILISKEAIKLEPINIQSKNQINQISDITIAGSDLNENLKANIAVTLMNYPNIGINSFGSVVSKPSVRGFSGDRFL